SASTTPAPPDIHTLSLHDALPISFRLLGNRLWHVICAHNRYGEWMIGEASGIVGRFESRLRQQRNHTIFPAFGSPLDFHYQLLRSEEHTSELQSHLNLVCRLLLEK